MLPALALALTFGATLPLFAETLAPTLDGEGRWVLSSEALTLRAESVGVSAVTRSGFAPLFRLDALGRGGALVPLVSPAPDASPDGLSLADASVTLVFVVEASTPRLILTIDEALEDGEGPFRLRLQVVGSHLPRVQESGQIAALFGASAHDLVHAVLVDVSDAAGRSLPAHWEGDDAGLVLVIDDEGATYPISANAALSAASWLVDGDQADAFLGVAVAGLGDTNGDGYGDVAVGAYQWESSLVQEEEGRAYAFEGSAAGLASTPAWSPEGDQGGAFFGRRLAAAGDVNGDGYADLVVAATSWDSGSQNVGKVELFLGSETGLESAPSWTFEGGQPDESCGISVAGAGDVQQDGYDDVLVGCSGHDQNGEDSGRVLLFHGSAAGLSSTANWSYEGSHASELLGVSVAGGADLNGDTYHDVAVGAPGYANGQVNEGRALVFLGGPAGLALAPAWTASSDVASALFGQSVAILPDANGDGWGDLLVGAQLYEQSFAGEGAVFLYLGSAGGVSASPAWSVYGGQESARLGFAIASVGDVNADGLADALVGAFLYDGDLQDEGRMSLYLGHPDGLRGEASFVVEGDGLDARLGVSLASAGDVNGDGSLDVIAGAHFYTDTLSREGRAVVFHGPLIDPPPQLGDTLLVTREGDDLMLDWSPPASGGDEGPVTFYRVRSDSAANGAFPTLAETYVPSWRHIDAAIGGSSFRAYLVSAENSNATLD